MSFQSKSGITVDCKETSLDYQQGIDFLLSALICQRGIYLSSGTEEPDRYSRWEVGFVAPPLEITATSQQLTLRALSQRGRFILSILAPLFAEQNDYRLVSQDDDHVLCEVVKSDKNFSEEERSLQPSVLSPLRTLLNEFSESDDPLWGLYGAFGYDLIFQFETDIPLRHPRDENSVIMHLFLPDQIYLVDRKKEVCFCYTYAFNYRGKQSLAFDNTPFTPIKPLAVVDKQEANISSNYTDDAYAALVEKAKISMHQGDLFEIVLHRSFCAPNPYQVDQWFAYLTKQNPSPYAFLLQLGNEQLVGTSPEMFIRVKENRVESCPISGTIRGGDNAMEDAEQIKALFNSEKDEVELTMCTDVDRNDKSRVCEAGSVVLVARRLIERYKGLFHTVDHVKGRLRAGLTGIDAFLSHMWAVTLTGAPKPSAVALIEQMEDAPRTWYGGAIGGVLFDGQVNTGITIRTVHIKEGIAHYPVGATLVYDSQGDLEEQETRIKATTFFDAIESLNKKATTSTRAITNPGEGKRILLIDYNDSFVHTLADYFRRCGATVETYRHHLDLAALLHQHPYDLVVHSPGPGRPEDFSMEDKVRLLVKNNIPQFGVCLGLQGIVQAYGGKIATLATPRHGKRWQITHNQQGLFANIDQNIAVGAYHSLYADKATFPAELEVTAENEVGMIMGIRHRDLPIQAVQFHPESILSMVNGVGYQMIVNLFLSH